MREFIQLFRSLTLRQLLGLQLAWMSSIGLVFGFTTWLRERGFRPSPQDNISFSMSLRWELSTGQILAVALIVLAPALLWLAVRDRGSRHE